MSTKFVPTAGTSNLASPAGLCTYRPQNPSATELISKFLPASNTTAAIRPFDPASDTATVYKWMSLEYEGPLKGKPTPPQGMRDSYSAMLDSDMTQPFIGTVNNIPVCQINISSIQLDVLSLAYESKPADYVLQMVLAPLSIHDNMVALLQVGLDYFFSFREVNRIVTDVDDRSEWLRNLYTRVGFRSGKKLHDAYHTSHLLFCTKNTLKRAAKLPLLAGLH